MSGSENRARQKFLPLRMDEVEAAWLQEQADRAGITRSELARALIFGRQPARAVVPCNTRHTGCTAHHRNLVDSYRDQRQRELEALEVETGGYRGDHELWEANGGRLTTFGDWLKARAG